MGEQSAAGPKSGKSVRQARSGAETAYTPIDDWPKTSGSSLKCEPEQRSALDDSDISRLLEFFRLLDRWDREGAHDAKVM
jgi:hypothetical protein